MIDEMVRAEVQDFTRVWKESLSGSRLLALDHSYMSLGVLDMLISPLRGNKESALLRERMLRGASAYLGVFVHDTLAAIGVPIEVRLSSEGITLHAPGGFGPGDGEAATAPLEQFLAGLLADPPPTLQVFKNFSRIVPMNGNWLTPITLGLLLGSSPMIEGFTRDISDEYMEREGDKVIQQLAKQCSEWYERVFPEEKLGQVAELFLRRLIFPPLYYREEVPGIEAIRGLHEFLKEYQPSPSMILQLLENLSQVPDEQIACSSLCYLVAVSPDEPSLHVYAACRRQGAFLGLLREALVEARKLLDLGGDWIHSLKPFSPDEKNRIEQEIHLGFIPWLKLPVESLFPMPEDEQLSLCVRALADFDLMRAKAAFDHLIDVSPAEISVRVQRVYLEIVGGDIESALKQAKQLLTEPESESSPAVYNVLGMIHLLLRDPDSALQAFDVARLHCANDPILAAEVGNNFAWSLLAKNRFEDALDVIDLSLAATPDKLILHLNRMAALLGLGKTDEANREEARILALAPLHPRVFFAITQPTYAMLGQAVH